MNIAALFPKCILALLPLWIVCSCPAAQQTESFDTSSKSYSANAAATQADHDMEKALRSGTLALVKLLQQPFPAPLEAPLKDEAKDVYSGKFLPTVVYETALPFRLSDSIIFGERYASTAEEFRVARRTIFLILELEKRHSTGLVDWLAQQSDRLPPCPRDVIAFAALGTGTGPRRDTVFWQSTASQWRRMLGSSNAIYRLMAFSRLQGFETNRSRILEACNNAFKEKNSIFHFHALSHLAMLGGPDAIAAIDAFLKSNPSPDDGSLPVDSDIRTIAEETLSTLKKSQRIP